MAKGKAWLKAALCLSPLVPALAFPGIGALVSLAIVVAALIFVRSSRGPTLALVYVSHVRSLAIGIVFGLVVALSFHFVFEPLIEWFSGRPIDLEGLTEVEGDFSNFLILLALGLLFGGIAEELIFRGFVVGWGAALFGDRAAPWLVLLSATVFGVTHLYQGIAGTISTGLIGLAFGLLYLWAGRKLLPAIAAHMTVNAYGVTLLYFGIS